MTRFLMTRPRPCAFASAVLLTCCLVGQAGVASADPGDLDGSFGDDGTVVIGVPPGGQSGFAATSIAAAPHGATWIAANNYEAFSGTNVHVVATALRSDGSVDGDFGAHGQLSWQAKKDGEAQSTAVTGAIAGPRGGLLVTGSLSSDYDHFTLYSARFDRTGDLDKAYGRNGVARLVKLPSSRSGRAFLAEDGAAIACSTPADHRLSVAALTPEGDSDAGFGTEGLATVHVRPNRTDDPIACARTADGGAVVVLGTVSVGGTSQTSIAHLTAMGKLDRSFGDHGLATFDLPLQPFEAHIAADGEVMIGGVAAGSFDDPSYPAIAKVTSEGTLDPGYGAAGVAVLADPRMDDTDTLVWPHFAFADSGVVTVAGSNGTTDRFAFLARATSDGELDLTFADDGVATDFVDGEAMSDAVALDSKRRPLVAYGADAYRPAFGVSRFQR
jgi:uncharacterized delta-60 repeat protein